MILASEFPHRPNRDGTIDSICPHCYLTIGTATWEVDLEQMEVVHVCNPERLHHFQREQKQVPKKIENWTSSQSTAAVA